MTTADQRSKTMAYTIQQLTPSPSDYSREIRQAALDAYNSALSARGMNADHRGVLRARKIMPGFQSPLTAIRLEKERAAAIKAGTPASHFDHAPKNDFILADGVWQYV